MNSKLPAWVGLGAFMLSLAAGCMNAFTLVSLIALPVTHSTGTTSAFSIALAHGDFSQALYLLGLIIAFVLGAVSSGLLIRDYHLKLGRRYGIALMSEAALVTIAFVSYQDDPLVTHFLLAFAAGLQNAMATTYSGAVVRTTHVTGILTDLGIQAARAITGQRVDRPRIFLFIWIFVGFVTGSFFAAFFFPILGALVLLLVILLSGGTGLAYYVYRILAMRKQSLTVKPGSQ